MLFPPLSRNILREITAYFSTEQRPYVVLEDKVCTWDVESKEWKTEYILNRKLRIKRNSIAAIYAQDRYIVCCLGANRMKYSRARDV